MTDEISRAGATLDYIKFMYILFVVYSFECVQIVRRMCIV